MIRRALFVGLILMLVAGCTKATPQPTPKPVSTPTRKSTPLPTLPFTPTVVIAFIQTRDLPVNCRFGPGLVYEIIGSLKPDQSASISGKDSTGLWWQIRDPGNPGGFCWVDKEAVDADKNAEAVPVVNAPLVTVTNLDIQVDPPRLVIGCDGFPQIFVFKADITVSGPTIVMWRWEVSTGDVGSQESMIFEEAGTQSVQEFYRIQYPNDYSVNIHVLSPNDMTVRSIFFAQCTP